MVLSRSNWRFRRSDDEEPSDSVICNGHRHFLFQLYIFASGTWRDSKVGSRAVYLPTTQDRQLNVAEVAWQPIISYRKFCHLSVLGFCFK